MRTGYEKISDSDLEQLEATLRATIIASDDCMTWAYYGRASRAELRDVIAEKNRRFSRRTQS